MIYYNYSWQKVLNVTPLALGPQLVAAPCQPSLAVLPLPQPPSPPPYLEADCCILVAITVASPIDVVVVIASPPSWGTYRPEQPRAGDEEYDLAAITLALLPHHCRVWKEGQSPRRRIVIVIFFGHAADHFFSENSQKSTKIENWRL
jgi:hypothetical protein